MPGSELPRFCRSSAKIRVLAAGTTLAERDFPAVSQDAQKRMNFDGRLPRQWLAHAPDRGPRDSSRSPGRIGGSISSENRGGRSGPARPANFQPEVEIAKSMSASAESQRFSAIGPLSRTAAKSSIFKIARDSRGKTAARRRHHGLSYAWDVAAPVMGHHVALDPGQNRAA